jgi:hypothetical protein
MENICLNVKYFSSIGEERGGVMPMQLQKKTSMRGGWMLTGRQMI